MPNAGEGVTIRINLEQPIQWNRELTEALEKMTAHVENLGTLLEAMEADWMATPLWIREVMGDHTITIEIRANPDGLPPDDSGP